MYFGYNEMWRFTFVPVGFVLTMAAAVGFALVYAVGASRGPTAAATYVRWLSFLFVGLAAADLLWAAASGQLGRFLGVYGP